MGYSPLGSLDLQRSSAPIGIAAYLKLMHPGMSIFQKNDISHLLGPKKGPKRYLDPILGPFFMSLDVKL